MRYLIFFSFLMISADTFSQADQPTTDFGNLKKYAADNAILTQPAQGEKRVVFMGNSITEFWQYANPIFFNHRTSINRGISGQTTPQMLIRFRQDVIDLHPDVVVILAGINDIAENTGHITQEQSFGNIVSMTELAKANNIRVVLCSVLPAIDFPWHPGLEPAEKVIRLNGLIKAYCTREKIVYVDYYTSMVDEHKGLDKRYGDDGVHPNATGYKVMEPLVTAGIAKAMKGRK